MMASKKDKKSPIVPVGRTIVTKVSNDDTDISPEPSPTGPPLPTEQSVHMFPPQQQHIFDIGHWTPRQTTTTLDDGSFSTLPDIPSPYSPPPASLFSGEEWPEASGAKRPFPSRPPSEVNMNTTHLNQSGDNGAHINTKSFYNFGKLGLSSVATSHKNSQKEQSPMAPMTLLSHESNASNRSHVLPTVMYLKQSLQESHQVQYLLRQENSSLAIECDRFQEEIGKWQEYASEAKNEAEENKRSLSRNVNELSVRNKELLSEQENMTQDFRYREEKYAATVSEMKLECTNLRDKVKEMALQKEEITKIFSELREDKQKLSNDLISIRANVKCKDEQHKTLSSQVVRLEQGVQDVRTKLKGQAMEHSNLLKQKDIDHEAKIMSLSKEATSANFEFLRLQAMLNENKLTVKRLKEENEKFKVSQDTISSLEMELADLKKINLQIVNELNLTKEKSDESVCKATTELSSEINRLNVKEKMSEEKYLGLEQKHDSLQVIHNNCKNELHKCKDDIAVIRDEANRLQTELVQCMEKLTEVQQQNDHLQVSDNTLQEELKRTNLKVEQIEIERARFEMSWIQSESACNQYKAEIINLQENQNDSLATMAELNTKNENLSNQVVTLTTSLQEANKTISLLSDRKGNAMQLQITHIRNNSVCRSENSSLDDSFFGSPVNNPIADRFMLIKDSVERATLNKEYQQELARVRKDYEQEINFLTTTHNHNLKEILHEAKIELKSRIHENKKRVQDEVKSKVANFRLKHQAEIDKVCITLHSNFAINFFSNK